MSNNWTTIETTKRIKLLAEFRANSEAEAETSIANIPTNLALALADVAEAMGIKEPEDMLEILGPGAYLAVYQDPIPYKLTPAKHRSGLGTLPAHFAVNLLLARLRDTWRGKWSGEPAT